MLKHRRALASRYDARDVDYRDSISVATVVDWLRHLTRPGRSRLPQWAEQHRGRGCRSGPDPLGSW